jgi:hypothetical protein
VELALQGPERGERGDARQGGRSGHEVAAEVTGVTADVTPGGAEVTAACACRENSSKTAKIPAAKIATCTAR